jgi:hypothetical protein
MPLKSRFAALVALSCACFPLVLVPAGCGNSAGDSQKTVTERDRLTDMRTKSGGDWDKLSQDDKDYVLKMADGSESTARMLFNPLGGHGGPGVHPGGPGPGKSTGQGK